MSGLSFDALPPWAMLLSILAHLAAGIVLGILYFRSLWRSICRSVDGRPMTAIALTIGRFAILGCLLTLAGWEGALPLLVMALGVFIPRSAIMRKIREA